MLVTENLVMNAALSKSRDSCVASDKLSYQLLAMPFRWKGKAIAALGLSIFKNAAHLSKYIHHLWGSSPWPLKFQVGSADS